MKVYRYLLLQLKMCAKSIPVTLAFFALAVLVVSSFVTVKNAASSDDEAEKIKLGIVGNSENKFVNFGVDFLQNSDESKEYLDVQLYDSREQAVELVEKGELAACVVVSDEFIDNLRRGKNISIDFITKKGNVDLYSAIINDVVVTVSGMVVDVQSAAFATEEYLVTEKELDDGKLMTRINLYLLDRILARGTLAKTVKVSNDGVSLGGYYFCSAIVLLIVFIGIVNAPLLNRNNTDLYRLLSVGGCGEFRQTLCESAAYIFAVLVEVFACLAAVAALLGGKLASVKELSAFGMDDAAVLFVKIIPFTVLLCFMQMLVYSLCKSLVSGLLMQFVVSVGLCYISGCFYPSYFFPKQLSDIAKILPLGCSFNGIQNSLSGNFDLSVLVVCLLWIAVIAALMTVRRRLSLRVGDKK